MIIAGAGGFAKEVFEILNQSNQAKDVVVYVNIPVAHSKFMGFIDVISNSSDLKFHFEKFGNECVVGIGNPQKRKIFTDELKALGGQLVTVKSANTDIGSVDVKIGDGTIVLSGTCISNGVQIGQGCILYYNSIITHDCVVGDFVEISPGATLLGKAKVGSYCQIGANSTILPGVILGQNVIVGAGAVVTEDQPDNTVVAGVPAKYLKQSPQLSF